MTEERKYAILFAATLLSARKLIEMDPNKPSIAKGFLVDTTIDDGRVAQASRTRPIFRAPSMRSMSGVVLP
jgi:hypothetical protein